MVVRTRPMRSTYQKAIEHATDEWKGRAVHSGTVARVGVCPHHMTSHAPSNLRPFVRD